MKRYLLLSATLIVVFAAAVFGAVKRRTYTNIAEEEDYLDQLLVAEFPEELTEYACEKLRTTLPEAPIIAKVTTTGELEHLFGADRQKVCIQELYAGNGLEAGQEVYVYMRGWCLIVREDLNAIERNFVNVMRVGTEYLIFGDGLFEDLMGLPTISLCDNAFIAPVFCYEESPHVILPTSDEGTYVPYAEVKENEFFPESEEALELWKALKAEMMAAYP